MYNLSFHKTFLINVKRKQIVYFTRDTENGFRNSIFIPIPNKVDNLI